ncbi:MAG: undecaprenyl-diphosphate phosphatase [Sphaerochaeta sp.]|nr:undecaprenyl-diphosphate phosphatase [Sphaerochaeta sp.]
MNNTVSAFEGIVLGFVQGLTEFLPVSSSGHLVLVRDYFAIGQVPLLFDVLLHVATLFVIIYHYRVLVLRLVMAAYRFVTKRRRPEDADDLRLVAVVLGATILTVAVALAIRIGGLDNESRRSVSVSMLLTAVLLTTTAWVGKVVRPTGTYTWLQMLVTGIAQGFGTLAGISRSGITLTASLWSGMQREKAGEYTFILSIPAVLGALVLTLADDQASHISVGFLPTALGCAAAFLTGLVALRLLLWMVKHARLWYFSFYLAALGLFGLFVKV